jgi:hypothetical protein
MKSACSGEVQGIDGKRQDGDGTTGMSKIGDSESVASVSVSGRKLHSLLNVSEAGAVAGLSTWKERAELW